MDTIRETVLCANEIILIGVEECIFRVGRAKIEKRTMRIDFVRFD